MINDDLKDKMKQRYEHIHPLLFQRSYEYSRSAGELFDILESLPEPPFAWNQKIRRWMTLDDLTNVKFPDN